MSDLLLHVKQFASWLRAGRGSTTVVGGYCFRIDKLNEYLASLTADWQRLISAVGHEPSVELNLKLGLLRVPVLKTPTEHHYNADQVEPVCAFLDYIATMLESGERLASLTSTWNNIESSATAFNSPTVLSAILSRAAKAQGKGDQAAIEFELKVKRASEVERREHIKTASQIEEDHHNRRVYVCTGFIGTRMDVEIKHLARLAVLTRSEFFGAAAMNGITVDDSDASAVSKALRLVMRTCYDSFFAKLRADFEQRGFRPMVDGMKVLGERLLATAIELEAVDGVQLALIELRRQQESWTMRVPALEPSATPEQAAAKSAVQVAARARDKIGSGTAAARDSAGVGTDATNSRDMTGDGDDGAERDNPPAPTKYGKRAGEDDRPSDIISARVAVQQFHVSRTTLKREAKSGERLKSYRRQGASRNAQHLFSESELSKLYERR